MNLKSAIYGLVVGDALGVPFEFKRRNSFTCIDMVGYGTYNLPAGTFSDDSSLTLATATAIKDSHGKIDLDLMRVYFEDWLFDGRFTPDGKTFDVGNTTQNALEEGKGMTDIRDNGNGSLMRIIPVAFTDADDETIRKVSAITHAHPIAMDACVEYVKIAREILAGKTYTNDEIKNQDISKIKSGGYVVDTLNASLWCILNTDNYKDAVLKAVNLGQDTDTTAAVTGALAGIIYGYDSIPHEWIEKIRNKEIIDASLF